MFRAHFRTLRSRTRVRESNAQPGFPIGILCPFRHSAACRVQVWACSQWRFWLARLLLSAELSVPNSLLRRRVLLLKRDRIFTSNFQSTLTSAGSTPQTRQNFYIEFFLSPFWPYGPVAISSTSHHFPEPHFRACWDFFHAPLVLIRRFVFFVPTNSRKVLCCLSNFDCFESGPSVGDRSGTFFEVARIVEGLHMRHARHFAPVLANLGCIDPHATANYVHQVRYTLHVICYSAAILYRQSTTDVTHRFIECKSGHQSSLVHLCSLHPAEGLVNFGFVIV